jgi:hypothetical protein
VGPAALAVSGGARSACRLSESTVVEGSEGMQLFEGQINAILGESNLQAKGRPRRVLGYIEVSGKVNQSLPCVPAFYPLLK